MAERGTAKEFSINTIVGPGTSVHGDIAAAGFTRVDGAIQGDVLALGRVVVGEKARMKSNVSGTLVTIGGVVYGNVTASDRVVLLSTGLVLGDVITRAIKAEDGCLIHGRVMICATEEKWRKTVADYQDSKAIRNG